MRNWGVISGASTVSTQPPVHGASRAKPRHPQVCQARLSNADESPAVSSLDDIILFQSALQDRPSKPAVLELPLQQALDEPSTLDLPGTSSHDAAEEPPRRAIIRPTSRPPRSTTTRRQMLQGDTPASAEPAQPPSTAGPSALDSAADVSPSTGWNPALAWAEDPADSPSSPSPSPGPSGPPSPTVIRATPPTPPTPTAPPQPTSTKLSGLNPPPTSAPTGPKGGRGSGGRTRVIRSTGGSRNRMGASWDTAAGPLVSAAPAAPAPAASAPVTATQEQLDAVAGGPAWAQALFGNAPADGSDGPVPQLQRAVATEPQAGPEFKEHELPMQGFLELRSQEEELIAVSRTYELPPLQSVLELTTAYKAPTRSLEAVAEGEVETATATAPVGRQIPLGAGTLADGTMYEKTSGEDFGPGGYWKRWTLLKGTNAEGTVVWEETWWEASDWAGLKELGARKSGTSAEGGAWNEEWCERAFHDPQTIELIIERTAHKWARADGEAGHEWEEKWGEKHRALGQVNKYADKWAKEDGNVWHEKWGEDYDGRGGCLKYTDKWAEREVWGGGVEQWGDKWTENFADGKGTKHGEVWSISAGGDRYNRWWNEHHMGDNQVRKWGDSNTGEHWDQVENMDTYYNPVPHFGFSLAVRHSPSLMKVAELPRNRRSPASDGSATTSSTSGAPAAGAASAAPQEEDEDWQSLGQGLGALNWGEEEEEEVAPPPVAPLFVAKAPTAPVAPAPPAAPVPPKGTPPAQDATQGAGAASLDWSEVLRSVKSKAANASKQPEA